MNKFLKNKVSQKVIASFLSFVMVLSLIPLSSISAMAASGSANESVASGDVELISDGKNENGNDHLEDEPLEGAYAEGDMGEEPDSNADVGGNENDGENTDMDGNEDAGENSDSVEDEDASEGGDSGEAGNASEDGNTGEGDNTDNVIDFEEEEADITEDSLALLNNVSVVSMEVVEEGSEDESDDIGVVVNFANVLVYNGKEQELVESITGIDLSTDTVSYKLTENGESEDGGIEAEVSGDGEPEKGNLDSEKWIEVTPTYDENSAEWKIEELTATDAGTYKAGIKVVRTNGDGEEKSKTYEELVTINKAHQEIVFDNPDYNEKEASTEIHKGVIPEGGINFDFSAHKTDESIEGEITYSVDTPADIAKMNEDVEGQLIVYAPCTVTVEAAIRDDKNYENVPSVKHTLTVMQRGHLISFDESTIKYIFGENGGVISEQKVRFNEGTEREEEEPETSYEISEDTEENEKQPPIYYEIDVTDDVGILCDSDTGKITVSESGYAKLDAAMDGKDEPLTITVHAILYESALDDGGTDEDETDDDKISGVDIADEYEIADEASYEIKISYEKKPDEPLSMIEGEEGKAPWYISKVVIIPAEGYLISRSCDPEQFGEELTLADNDTNNEGLFVYLRKQVEEESGGGITAKISIAEFEKGIKIDTAKPNNISISYLNPEPASAGNYYFYGQSVKVRFTAEDVTSGVAYFEWKYTRSADASVSNKASDTESYIQKAVPVSPGSTRYTAEFTLPIKEAEQLRGYLSVKAIDQAGNESDWKEDSGKIFVRDTIAPKLSHPAVDENDISQTVGTRHYFSEDVKLTIDIVEANFFGEDVIITIIKDETELQFDPVSWSKTDNLDEHRANITLSEEGEYVIAISYADRSGNQMDDYLSETIIIDKTKPVIEFYYPEHISKNTPQTATVTITEKNFRPDDIEVVTQAKDIKGNTVAANDLQKHLRTCEWTMTGDVHSAEISSQFVDANYKLTINYKDLALNAAETVETEWFVVDHTAPDAGNMSVEYTLPIKETLLSNITFGYYNPTVTVTFTAYDMTSGIDYFTWNFKKQKGINTDSVTEYGNTVLDAVQDNDDKSKFSASMALPKNQADQLRGNITFFTTDKCDNESDGLTDDGHVIIVDTIAPNLTAEYTPAIQTVDNKLYYNYELTATFTVTETNFYSEDIVVNLKRDKGGAIRIKPVWREVSTDVHVGTYTVSAPSDHSGDGDYVFTVTYTDRSNNRMSTYTSSTFVIDTLAPVIEVTYSKQGGNIASTGADGNTTEYYNTEQVATVTVNERNFNPDDMEFTIEATDHAGGTLDADSLYIESPWNSNGDSHTMTITYPGDANYSFRLEYTDLASNKAVDYETDYFTVDTEPPTDLTISYGVSVLETVLATVTFGFYNAKASVTIEASDNISSVGSFKYSYLNAEGVSTINAELIEQIIEEPDISYSNSGVTASATFEIPAAALGSNNQFNGTVTFDAMDRAGNESDYLEDTYRVVVDNIAPTVTVEYNTPIQTVDGISYYDADVTATVTINEANFYAEDVVVTATRDGADYPVSASWGDNSTDVHTGNFTLTGDGDYFVTVSYADKSGNEMEPYVSEQLTIDTEIAEAVILINGEDADGKAFKDDVVPYISFEDPNFEAYDIALTRTSYAAKNVDVTNKFITGYVTLNKTGGSGTFDTFGKSEDNDGIYTLTVSLTDRSGHFIEKSATFTVNRYGSVYEYSDYLVSLIQDGGAYVQEVQDNIVITEYNADRLVSQSLDIVISKDGRPLDDPDYKVTPDINSSAQTGESGWYQYQYTINKTNFSTDGLYKVSVSSADETGNTPENSNYEDKLISFWVDSTAPEINSITGLEEQIVNAANVDVDYTVYDTIGLKSVTVYVSGKEIDRISDFSDDINNFSGRFTLYEDSQVQPVRLVVADLAGNITDTAASDFKSAYIFNSLVTVSTNFLVRLYADRMLFWGSIGGCTALVCGSGIGIYVFKRRRKLRQ